MLIEKLLFILISYLYSEISNLLYLFYWFHFYNINKVHSDSTQTHIFILISFKVKHLSVLNLIIHRNSWYSFFRRGRHYSNLVESTKGNTYTFYVYFLNVWYLKWMCLFCYLIMINICKYKRVLKDNWNFIPNKIL